MNRSSRLFAACLLALLLAALLPLPAHGASPAPALGSIQGAYVKVLQAEQEGANVSVQVSELNQALALVQQGEASNQTRAAQLYGRAQAMASAVEAQLPQAIAQGQAAARTELILLGSYLGGIAVAVGAIYFYGGRVFWTVWIRLHRDWTVRRVKGDR
ncbi:MAG: hypothetical protein JRN29_04155 [Nitrososphaerota archaeon]|nr:hypothetical protein [Nitrososphaerota archaeon]